MEQAPSFEKKTRPDLETEKTTPPALDTQKSELERGRDVLEDEVSIQHESQNVEQDVVVKSPELIDAERFLSDGLGDVYASLPKEKRVQFRSAGEALARETAVFIESDTLNEHEVLKKVMAWLAILPDVKKSFLEQTAKVKTDGVIRRWRMRHPE